MKVFADGYPNRSFWTVWSLYQCVWTANLVNLWCRISLPENNVPIAWFLQWDKYKSLSPTSWSFNAHENLSALHGVQSRVEDIIEWRVWEWSICKRIRWFRVSLASMSGVSVAWHIRKIVNRTFTPINVFSMPQIEWLLRYCLDPCKFDFVLTRSWVLEINLHMR